jgi:plastocyanin domain-containing protein
MVMASGVLVMALGTVMVARGANLFGIGLPALTRPDANGVAIARISGGVQEVRTTVDSGQYHPFVVQSGIPVRWIISAKADDLNGCNNPLTIPAYGIRKELVPGDNVVEFTPSGTGTITYTCWMGMISSTITVVADLAAVRSGGVTTASADASPIFVPAGSGSAAASGGCCGTTPERFASGRVPVDAVQVARRSGDTQVAEVTVDANGYTPAVIVLQRGVKAKIRFVAAALSGCNYLVQFPEYQGQLDLSKGQLETPYLEITSDFTFQCGMGMLHGYVKVVDDTSTVDLQAVKREVAAYVPVTASAGAAGGCCGQ